MEAELDAVRDAMAPSIEERADRLITELDELIALSRQPGRAGEFQKQIHLFGSALTRAQMLCDFIQSHRPNSLRLVSNRTA